MWLEGVHNKGEGSPAGASGKEVCGGAEHAGGERARLVVRIAPVREVPDDALLQGWFALEPRREPASQLGVGYARGATPDLPASPDETMKAAAKALVR